MGTAPTFLLANLLHFGRLLHSLGVVVQAGCMLDAASALEHIEIGRRSDFYFTLRTLLVRRHQDLPVFDEAFQAFWRRPPGESLEIARAPREPGRFGKPAIDIPLAQPEIPDAASPRTLAEPVERVAPMSYSAQGVSRLKDFAQFTKEELDRAQTVIATMTWDPGMRVTRRWTPGRGAAVDWRTLVRRSIGHGGEPLVIPRRKRALKRRRLVLLCDVSGSMERYARMLLHFMEGLAGRDRVEAFVFATRLTRITRELTPRHRRQSAPSIPGLVPDWAGGTRIGDAIHAFNVRWARRVMGHQPVVLLISDGWDRGEPEPLARELGRLQRTSRRLIWLNPLLGSPSYRPLTRGMQAALPFIDDFLPVHNLASLESLAEHLNRLPESRGLRRTGGR